MSCCVDSIWFSNKLDSLKDGGAMEILSDLKCALSSLPQDVIDSLPRNNLAALFACISENEEESDLASDILAVLLPTLTSIDVLTTYGSEIKRSLAHSSANVRINFLKFLLCKCITLECLDYLKQEQHMILVQVVDCLTCTNRSIGDCAIQFFKKVGSLQREHIILLEEPIIGLIKAAMASNDITRFRVYEIAVDVAVSSESHGVEEAHRAGILPALLLEVKSSDPLLQLNALELLNHLASNNYGYLYLQREGVVNFLLQQKTVHRDEPFSSVFLSGLMEFFSNLCALQPAVFSQQHPEALQWLLDSVEDLDATLLPVAISSLAKIGMTDEGKCVLQAQKLSRIMKKLGEIIQRKDELGLAGMNAVATLLTTDDASLFQETQEWFDCLGKNAFDTIVSVCKLPFLELRLGALKLLGVLARLTWAAPLFSHYAGILEFLLDRSVEFDKDCQMAKHEVVKWLSNNRVFTGEISLKLKQHVNEGPFYVSAEPKIALE